ncbi:AAA family ATPase [Pseudomonas sp. R2.Fl]|nr:AAA family ATPase [Pseudomonas sp. R2.Fl]
MDIQDQSAVVAFLRRPESHGSTEEVKVIETHISLVFLTGDRAYKLKRAIKLPYADFSTLDLRRAYCLREVELNGRATPELYLGIRTITRQRDGSLAFDGGGEPLDVVVEMARFAQHDLFDRMAADDRLTPALMEETAGMIAAFHAQAPVIHLTSGSANMEGVLTINEAGFATSHVFSGQEVARLTGAFRTAWAAHAEALDRREKAGKVRLCHGDLHLRNIFMGPNGPRLFDCIDFNDQIATVDVLYDLAFLLMDLWHRDHANFASIVVNRYLDVIGDESDFALLPFLMAVRAEVRAHVTATQVEEGGGASEALAASARGYFDFAETLLRPGKPRLIAIGGLSGSGKSTLAEKLAPLVGGPPGARIEESDRVRKAMFGSAVDARLPLEAYRPDVSEKVYATLRQRAADIVAGGSTVIVNAVFDHEADRRAIEEVAAKLSVPFTGIWLAADIDTLMSRVAARPQGASDATVDIVRKQIDRDIGSLSWHRLDATLPIDTVLKAATGLSAG